MERPHGLPLKQANRASVEAHIIQINLFPRLKLESAIRAEWAVGFGIKCRYKENGFGGIIQPSG